MAKRKTQKIGTLPGQTSMESIEKAMWDDMEKKYPEIIQTMIDKGPLNSKTNAELYAELGQPYTKNEMQPDVSDFEDKWAASAVATQKREGETDLQAYQRIREEKRQRLLKIGVGFSNDPNLVMNAGMTPQQEAAFAGMTDEQKATFRQEAAIRQGFKSADDLLEQASDVAMGSMSVNRKWSPADGSAGMTLRDKFLHKNPSAEAREEAIMAAGRKAFQARNEGYNIGKIRSAPAQKILDAVAAERNARMAQEREKAAAASANNIVAPNISTDNSQHNTHMGRQSSRTSDQRVLKRRMTAA